jgi:hypothetical protein
VDPAVERHNVVSWGPGTERVRVDLLGLRAGRCLARRPVRHDPALERQLVHELRERLERTLYCVWGAPNGDVWIAAADNRVLWWKSGQ